MDEIYNGQSPPLNGRVEPPPPRWVPLAGRATCTARGLTDLRGGNGRMEKNTETVYSKAGARWGTALYLDTVTPRQAQGFYYTLLTVKEEMGAFPPQDLKLDDGNNSPRPVCTGLSLLH